MLGDRLDKEWRERRTSIPIDAIMRFSDHGLVLGAGTVLIEGSVPGRGVSREALESRLRTLLTVAHLRAPAVSAVAHIRAATERWRQGEPDLAGVHLALSRLQGLERPEADAQRLFLADQLMNQGVEAACVLKALDLPDSDLGGVEKYSPDQPRVPAGSGRTSGQWTTGDGASATSARSGPGFSARPLTPRPEVNSDSITPVAGRHVGDDACHLAAIDCIRHVITTSYGAHANDNWLTGALAECKIAETKCEAAGALVERNPKISGAVAPFPDGGKVLIQKGEEDIYIPAKPIGRRLF